MDTPTSKQVYINPSNPLHAQPTLFHLLNFFARVPSYCKVPRGERSDGLVRAGVSAYSSQFAGARPVNYRYLMMCLPEQEIPWSEVIEAIETNDEYEKRTSVDKLWSTHELDEIGAFATLEDAVVGKILRTGNIPSKS